MKNKDKEKQKKALKLLANALGFSIEFKEKRSRTKAIIKKKSEKILLKENNLMSAISKELSNYKASSFGINEKIMFFLKNGEVRSYKEIAKLIVNFFQDEDDLIKVEKKVYSILLRESKKKNGYIIKKGKGRFLINPKKEGMALKSLNNMKLAYNEDDEENIINTFNNKSIDNVLEKNEVNNKLDSKDINFDDDVIDDEIKVAGKDSFDDFNYGYGVSELSKEVAILILRMSGVSASNYIDDEKTITIKGGIASFKFSKKPDANGKLNVLIATKEKLPEDLKNVKKVKDKVYLIEVFKEWDNGFMAIEKILEFLF